MSAHPSINTLYGVNGAGKTSVLESIAVLSRGRSFRNNKVARIIGPAASGLRVYAEIQNDPNAQKPGSKPTRLGLERDPNGWRARRDGEELKQLSDLAQALAVVVMEPNSHSLISGAPEIRRRYLDWGVFHVEPRYLEAWRRYARALKQRNAALRSGERAVLDSLESVLASAGDHRTSTRLLEEVTDFSGIESPSHVKIHLDVRPWMIALRPSRTLWGRIPVAT